MLELVDIGNKNNNLISPLECVMLLGVTGRNAAGKTTIVEWFVNQGWEGCSCSDAIRHWLRENGQEITRENLTQGGRTLRSKGGGGVLAEMLLERMDSKKNTIIDSIRTPDEVHALRSRDDFLLLEVNVPLDLRWQRMQERARDGDPINYEFFLKQEDSEAIAENSSGQALIATAELSDIVINNDGTLSELYDSLEILTSNFNQNV
jgi:dephospho-CoA kinase